MQKYGRSISRRRGWGMRIGIDANPIFLRKGGIGYYTQNLLEVLTQVDTNHEYFLFKTVKNQPDYPLPLLARPNVRIIQTSKHWQKWRCRREGVELYHGTNFRLRGKGKIGNVITIHDLAFKRYPHFLKKQWGQSLSFLKTKRDAQRADRVIAVSRHTAEDIVEFFKIDPQKIRVIYHGIDEVFHHGVSEDSVSMVKQKFHIQTPSYLLFVGTLEPRKNLPTLIRSFQSLPNLHSEFSLVLAGGFGWRYDEVVELSRGLENRVILTGYITPEELISLYSGASLFIYPSFYEGFGMPLLEAMAMGVPIVASKTSSIPEVVGNAAFLFDPLSAEDLATAISRMIEDSSLSDSLRVKGKQRVKMFTWDRAARETLSCYEEVLFEKS
jgi:glycosyltransferase involved in cell wall biosynthesis